MTRTVSLSRRAKVAGLLAVCGWLCAPVVLGGEVLEEIVAWVNGDIITMSDYEKEEEVLVAQAYRELTGDDLDSYLETMRQNLLMTMIDRKILVDQAQRIYDLDVMGNIFLETFKEQQRIASDAELEEMLAQEGMTLESLKQRLIEMSAPDEVIRFEVRSRIAVSEAEIEEFYEKNQDKLMLAADVTLREIVLLTPEGTSRSETRERAQAVRQRVVDGEDFAEVAKEVSEAGTAESGGLLGEMKQGDLAEHLAGPAFTIPVGSVSEVIETNYGFHILKVEEREARHVTPLEDVHDRIRDLLHQVKYGTELDAYLEKVRAESEWCVKQKYKTKLALTDVTACDET